MRCVNHSTGQSASSPSPHTTAGAGANVAKTPGHVPVPPGHVSGTTGHVTTSPGHVSVGGDDCLVTGKGLLHYCIHGYVYMWSTLYRFQEMYETDAKTCHSKDQ